MNSHHTTPENLIATINGLVSSLESVRSNVDSPDKALNGSWYAFDHMLSDDITKARTAVAKARE